MALSVGIQGRKQCSHNGSLLLTHALEQGVEKGARWYLEGRAAS